MSNKILEIFYDLSFYDTRGSQYSVAKVMLTTNTQHLDIQVYRIVCEDLYGRQTFVRYSKLNSVLDDSKKELMEYAKKKCLLSVYDFKKFIDDRKNLPILIRTVKRYLAK